MTRWKPYVLSAALATALAMLAVPAQALVLFDNHFDDNDDDITTNLTGVGGGFTPYTTSAEITDPAGGTTVAMVNGYYAAGATLTSMSPVNALGTTFTWEMTNCSWGSWMSFDLVSPDDPARKLTFQLGSANTERVSVFGASGEASYLPWVWPNGSELPHGWASGPNTVTLTTDETGFALNWTTNPGSEIARKWNEVVSGPATYDLSTFTNGIGETLIHTWISNIGCSLTIDRITAQTTGGTPPAHPGDANRDGLVNLEDFGLLKDNFGATTGATWEMGDFNGDGGINLEDFGILKDHFGHSAGDSPIAAVPEPASLAACLAGACLLVRRRRGR